MIAKIENGNVNPSLDNLLRLLVSMGKTIKVVPKKLTKTFVSSNVSLHHHYFLLPAERYGVFLTSSSKPIFHFSQMWHHHTWRFNSSK